MSTDPRIPQPPAEIAKTLGYATLWQEGYAAALADLDSGLFDRPLPAEIDAAADYGFVVERIDYGFGPTNSWGVIFDGEVYGGVMDTRREAEAEAVRRWREDTRYL